MPLRHPRTASVLILACLAVGPVTALAQQPAAQPPAAPAADPPMTSSALPTRRATYRTLTEVNLEMERLAERYPEKVRRFALPHRTVLGQTVWALEISHQVAASSGKPVFVMTGLHHSREWPTVDLTMEFVHDLLMNDGSDPRITGALGRVRFIVVPVVNPDGYEMSRSLLLEQKRKNCRIEPDRTPTFEQCANPAAASAGVDLNRNYGAFWGGTGANVGAAGGSYRGPAPFSEPETRNMRDLFASNQVVVALSNHTPDARVLRVPSTVDEPPEPADLVPYDSLAQLLGQDMKWQAGPWPAIYYSASGTMEEQAYYSAGTLAFTFEHTPGQRSFHPPYSFVVDQYLGTGAYPGSSARAAFLRLLEAAADPSLHSVLEVKAPAGAKLTLSKAIALQTAAVLVADRDSTRGPALTVPITLTSELVVPAGTNAVTWHVNPSLRPSQSDKSFLQESWTLTCSVGGRESRRDVTVARGQRLAIDLGDCR
jgi:carboxypeptidase T